jgi:DNA primase catalytic subunit
MSALNWVHAERVGLKKDSLRAYPLRSSELVIDVDAYMNYNRHKHRQRNNESCKGCLENAKQLTVKILNLLEYNYSDIRVVFSGRAGFHIHVLDFRIDDWTKINEKNLLKSHVVARFKYVSMLAEEVPKAFDKSHFVLSCDTQRVISMPESLNAKTGLLCSYLGDSDEFRNLSIDDILRKARHGKASITGLNFTRASSLESYPIGTQLGAKHGVWR